MIFLTSYHHKFNILFFGSFIIIYNSQHDHPKDWNALNWSYGELLVDLYHKLYPHPHFYRVEDH